MLKVLFRYWRRKWLLRMRMQDFERNGMHATVGVQRRRQP